MLFEEYSKICEIKGFKPIHSDFEACEKEWMEIDDSTPKGVFVARWVVKNSDRLQPLEAILYGNGAAMENALHSLHRACAVLIGTGEIGLNIFNHPIRTSLCHKLVDSGLVRPEHVHRAKAHEPIPMIREFAREDALAFYIADQVFESMVASEYGDIDVNGRSATSCIRIKLDTVEKTLEIIDVYTLADKDGVGGFTI